MSHQAIILWLLIWPLASVQVRTEDAKPPVPAMCEDTLLTNCNFESGPGSGWWDHTAGGYNIIVNDPGVSYEGEWLAYLGGGNDAADYLWQGLGSGFNEAEPLRVILRWKVWTEETEPIPYDHLTVTIQTTHDQEIARLMDLSNLDASAGWQASTLVVYGLSGYADNELEIRFEATTDNILPTGFLVDVVQVVPALPSGGSVREAPGIMVRPS